MNKAASLCKAVALLWHTTALLRDPHFITRVIRESTVLYSLAPPSVILFLPRETPVAAPWRMRSAEKRGRCSLLSEGWTRSSYACRCGVFGFLRHPDHRREAVPHTCRHTYIHTYIDLLNFVFLRDCPSLASQSSNFHTGITCGTFPAFLCFPASFEIRNTPIVHTSTTTPGLYIPSDTTLLNHMHAQLRSARLYIAQQRSVAPCGAVRSRAVRCRALRCGAVSLRCVISFEN